MKDLQYSIDVVYPKDELLLVNSYTEAVFTVLKNKLSFDEIEDAILKLCDLNKNNNFTKLGG